MKQLSLVFIVALLVVISGCASLSDAYQTATNRYDAVNSKIGSARGIVSDVGSVKDKAKRITGK